MERRKLAQSIIISARENHEKEAVTLLGHELGEESLAFRAFAPLPLNTWLQIHLRFWDRTVGMVGRVVELKQYNGAWDGVMLFQTA